MKNIKKKNKKYQKLKSKRDNKKRWIEKKFKVKCNSRMNCSKPKTHVCSKKLTKIPRPMRKINKIRNKIRKQMLRILLKNKKYKKWYTVRNNYKKMLTKKGKKSKKALKYEIKMINKTHLKPIRKSNKPY